MLPRGEEGPLSGRSWRLVSDNCWSRAQEPQCTERTSGLSGNTDSSLRGVAVLQLITIHLAPYEESWESVLEGVLPESLRVPSHPVFNPPFPFNGCYLFFFQRFQLSLTAIHNVKHLNWDFRNVEKIGPGKAEKWGGTGGRKPFSRGCRSLIQPLPLCFGVPHLSRECRR